MKRSCLGKKISNRTIIPTERNEPNDFRPNLIWFGCSNRTFGFRTFTVEELSPAFGKMYFCPVVDSKAN